MNDVTVMGVPVVFHGGCYSDSEGLDWDAMPEECMDEQPRFEYGQAVKVSKECTNCRPETVGRVGIVTRVVEPMAWGETLYDVRLQEVRSKWMHVTNLSNFHDKVFGRMWIEANNLSDPDAREFALDALVQAHQHPDSRS